MSAKHNYIVLHIHLSTIDFNYFFKLLIFTIRFNRPVYGLPCVAAAAVTAACYTLPLCSLLAPLHMFPVRLVHKCLVYIEGVQVVSPHCSALGKLRFLSSACGGRPG